MRQHYECALLQVGTHPDMMLDVSRTLNNNKQIWSSRNRTVILCSKYKVGQWLIDNFRSNNMDSVSLVVNGHITLYDRVLHFSVWSYDDTV